ncbi:MAG: AAA family ATPase [Deltaproteobacteria bacterium]|nr:AAA family ATPase [Deltaproteobacteria bacterium]
MYRDFFGFRDKPFKNTPDPEVFFYSEHHRRGLATVRHGIQDGCGLILLIGEIGTGKTTICYCLQRQKDFTFCYLNNPYLDEAAFLRRVNLQLKVPLTRGYRRDPVEALRQHLVQQHRLGKRVILVIDEAHKIGLPILDQILVLANLQLAEAQLLQILLVGQPELVETLRNPRLRSLNQRIGIRYDLHSMSREDTIRYIYYRLEKAGGTDRGLFSNGALTAIWRGSQGTPRLINQLCDRALVEAYQQGKKRVGRREVRQVLGDPLYGTIFTPRVRSWSLNTGLVLLWAVNICLGGFLGLHYFSAANQLGFSMPWQVSEQVRLGQNYLRRPIPSYVAGAEKLAKRTGPSGAVENGGAVFAPTYAGRAESEPGPSPVQDQVIQVAPILQTDARYLPLTPERRRPEGYSSYYSGADLAGVTLSAIAWDDDPAKRIAVLNEQILHEGDLLGKIRLLRIEQDHVVLLSGNEHVIKSIKGLEGF